MIDRKTDQSGTATLQLIATMFCAAHLSHPGALAERRTLHRGIPLSNKWR